MTLWATYKYVNETKINHSSKFDYSGIFILTIALFCLIYPLIEGREKGWPVWSIALLIASVGIFTYFIYNQKQKWLNNKNPLIDVRLFKIKDFNIGLLAALFHFMLHTSYLLLSAVYLQNGLGISSMNCGLYFILPAILFILSSLIASKLIVRFGKRILQVGVLLLSITFLLQIQLLKPGVNTWMIISLMGIWGLGNGLVLPSLLNIALTSVPVEYAGAAAGVYSTFQQTASALGVCIIGGIFFYFSGQSWQIAYTAGITAILVAVQHVQLIAVQG
jgi:hypothetical protein